MQAFVVEALGGLDDWITVSPDWFGNRLLVESARELHDNNRKVVRVSTPSPYFLCPHFYLLPFIGASPWPRGITACSCVQSTLVFTLSSFFIFSSTPHFLWRVSPTRWHGYSDLVTAAAFVATQIMCHNRSINEPINRISNHHKAEFLIQKANAWESLEFSVALGASSDVDEQAFWRKMAIGDTTWSEVTCAMAQYLHPNALYLEEGRLRGRAASAEDAKEKQRMLEHFVSHWTQGIACGNKQTRSVGLMTYLCD